MLVSVNVSESACEMCSGESVVDVACMSWWSSLADVGRCIAKRHYMLTKSTGAGKLADIWPIYGNKTSANLVGKPAKYDVLSGSRYGFTKVLLYEEKNHAYQVFRDG